MLSTKKAYIKILLDKWDGRNVPVLSAMETQQACNDFFKNHAGNEASFQMTYGSDVTINANKKYVYTYNVTETGVPGSYGLNPFNGRYEQIQFEGDLDFEKLFDFLIDFDKASKSINLFESLKKIIDRGNLIGFSDKQWQSVILQFAKKYLPAEYSSLCRFTSDNGNLLFQNLVRFINSDSEIAKSRDQLSKVTRSPKEPIFLPVKSVQNYFTRILSLTFPTMEDDQIKNRADFLVTRCIPHFLSTIMAKKLQQHLLYKSSLGEKISIDNICSFI